MILVIRISGIVETDSDIEEALFRFRLRRKYSAVLLQNTRENLVLLKKVRNFVAYGEIDAKTLQLLIEKRAKPIGDKKIDAQKIIDQLGKKKLEDLDVKPFFTLHPPRGGIDSKKHFGVTKKAVLGDNKDKINDLVRRML